MKKILLILCLVPLSWSFSLAQNESALADETSYLSNAFGGSIVRNWQNSYSISSHMSEEYTYFVKTDFGMTCASTGSLPNFPALIAPSIPNLIIRDMKIVDHYAFICGNVLDSLAPSNYVSHGFWGYFDLNDFYNLNNLGVKINVFNSIREFYKLVAYYDISDYKVVALGSYIDDLSYPGVVQYPACLVEVNIMASPSSTQMIQFQFDTSGAPRELMYDLVLTNDYVVLVGILHSNIFPPYYPHSTICVHLADRHNVITDPVIQTRYLYSTGAHEVNGNIHATYLFKNQFAFSYVYRDAATGYFYTRVRVIDVPSMQMNDAQEFQTFDKDEPIELAYDSTNNILTLLHPMPFTYQSSYNRSYFVQLTPLTSPSLYQAPVLIPVNGLFSSLDMFSNEYYVSTGMNHWYYQHTIASQPNVNVCPKYNEINVSKITNILPTSYPFPYTPVPTTLYPDTRISVVQPTKINLLCDDE